MIKNTGKGLIIINLLGDRYEGEGKDDKRHGQGTYYHKSSRR